MLKIKSINNVAIASLASAGFLFGAANADAQCQKDSDHNVETTQLVAYQSGKKASDIVDTAVAADDFTTLVAAVQAAGLAETLKGEGPFTVFAPSDEAFEKIPASTLEELLKPENKEMLTAILTNHVVKGKTMAADVVEVDSVTAVGGGSLKVVAKGDSVMIGNAKVTATDIECSNGVIHVIDTVLLPTKDAGSDAKVGDKEMSEKDIVETAIASGKFDTLVAAVKAAELVETLQGDGPFTVFAPTEEAFAKIPAETLQELLKPEIKRSFKRS